MYGTDSQNERFHASLVGISYEVEEVNICRREVSHKVHTLLVVAKSVALQVIYVRI